MFFGKVVLEFSGNYPATSPATARLVWYTAGMRFNPEKITYFAKTDTRGQAVRFGIKAKDRQRHMYVIGKTGMGKSTLLENMAAQDIQNGEGVAFIDPHGSAAETLLEYIPEHRIDDVVYFAPFDMDHPVAFNVMEDVGADKRHLVVSGLMSTFKKIWVDAWSARMEYILTNALLALIEYPDTTLLSVTRLFVDKAYREKVVDYIQDPAVKSFWVDEFANYTDRFAAEALPAIQNKIGQFTGNPLIRNIIGQPKSSFNIRELMDNRKILIMNLSKGLVGETNANLLGSMLTTRIYLAAMSRADLPVETMRQMPNFYFYVDEFQSFANSTFSNILSEARKYHLNLIIAHQYIEQMEEEVKDAVFGNVGTTISFRVGPFDAEVLETIFTPKFLAADLVNLGFAQIYLTLMIDGVGSQPFSAVTLPPIEPPPVSYKQMTIAASRKNYANERAPVEKLVADLHAPTPRPERPKNDRPKSDQDRPSGGGQGSKGGVKNGAVNNNKPNNGGGSNHTSKPNNKAQTKSGPTKPDTTALRAVLSQVRDEPDRPSSQRIKEPETLGPGTRSATTREERPTSDSLPKNQGRSKNDRLQTNASSAKNKDSDTQLQELRSILAKLAAREPKTLDGAAQKPNKNNLSKQHSAGQRADRSGGPQTESDATHGGQADLKKTLHSVLKSQSSPSGLKEQISDSAPKSVSPSTTVDPDPLDPKQLQKMLKKGGASQPPYA